MIIPGLHSTKPERGFLDEFEEIKGTLDEDQAKVLFAKFLKNDPTFAANVLMGIQLYPIQHAIIKSMFLRDYGLYVLSRGFSKTYSAAIFAALYAIFNPGVKVGILAPTHRQSKFIFKHIEDFAKSRGGAFLNQCINHKGIKKGADAWEMNIGRSSIYAVPLADGSRIRGYRFNLILIDEALLLSDQVVNEVIRPFLNVYLDPINRQKYLHASKELIGLGELTAEEAKKYALPNQKLICLSSASYTFEYLYKMLCDYENKILSPKADVEGEDVSHCIFQLSYKMAPEGLLSKQNIEEAKNAMSSAQFGREYDAKFTDDANSFFSPKKMKEATIPDKQDPSTRVVGDPKKEYVLAIDPNYADSETSDHFAMCVLELDNENKAATMVHGYACPKSNSTYRAQYVKYLLDHFNIVYLIVDNAGGVKFIEDCNLTPIFQEGKVKLGFFEHDFLNTDRLEGLKSSKKAFDPLTQKIGHAQVFQSDWIRIANEHMQMCIEKKRLMFAAEIMTEKSFEDQKRSGIPIKDIYFDTLDDTLGEDDNKLVDFIEHQAYIVKLTKTECALIEVSNTAAGRQTFDLPTNLSRLSTPDRPRKDSYTALLLANWGAKCYWEMLDLDDKVEAFIPVSFG